MITLANFSGVSRPSGVTQYQGVSFNDSNNVRRGLLKGKLSSGSVGLMFVGDSIFNIYVVGRVGQACAQRWAPMCGAGAGMLSQGDSGWLISNFPPANNATVQQVVGPSSSGLRPGDAFLDGSTGHNLLRTVPIEFLAEYPNFGTTYSGNFYQNNCPNPGWDSGQNLLVRLIYRANTQAPTDHRIVGRARGSPGQVDAGNTQFNAQLNPTQILQQTMLFARGTGTNGSGYAQGRTWNSTELAGWRNDYLCMSVELETRPTGSIFWFYAGEGGYTTLSHTTAGETLNIGGFGPYLTYYSDDALAKHIQFLNLNTFVIYLGQNQASNENPGGGTPGAYKANIQSIIARYKAACVTAGVSNPSFVLVSNYPTTSDNTRTTNIATALREIALSDSTCEYVDLRQYVVDTYGNWSTWGTTGPVFTPDGIHPSATFSNIIADYIWASL
jgi:lysophospholipase L1-like esterase